MKEINEKLNSNEIEKVISKKKKSMHLKKNLKLRIKK